MNIKELAEQAGFVVGVSANADRQINHFAELVAAAERESCAKLCEEMLTEPMLVGWNGFKHYMTQCAQRIRGRTE